MIVLVGPSASGKTEISKILMNQYGYEKCVTTTTRAKRSGEVNGIDYHFVSKEMFNLLKDKNAFVETTVYHDHFYGLQVKDLRSKGVVVLDPEGVNHLLRWGIDIYIIYIKVKKDVRLARMIDRGDDLEVVERRISNDDLLFDIKRINQLNLVIDNNGNQLEDVCKKINYMYKLSLKRKEGV